MTSTVRRITSTIKLNNARMNVSNARVSSRFIRYVRVAAPCICFVPWSGTRILQAAAPTAPSCFCRWQRSSLLHRGFFTRRTIRRVDAVRIHPCSPFCKTDKTETPVPGSDTGVLGGRGWIARAALLKTAHWAVFALSSATAPQLFESTRSMSLALSQNKNLSALAYAEAF